MPPTIGAAIRRMTVAPAPVPPQDRQRPAHDGGHRHEDRPDTEARAMKDRFTQRGIVRAASPAVVPRVLEVEEHDDADLRRDARQRDEADTCRDRGRTCLRPIR